MDGGPGVGTQPLRLFYEAIMGLFPQRGVLLRVAKDRSVSRCLWIKLRTLISRGSGQPVQKAQVKLISDGAYRCLRP